MAEQKQIGIARKSGNVNTTEKSNLNGKLQEKENRFKDNAPQSPIKSAINKETSGMKVNWANTMKKKEKKKEKGVLQWQTEEEKRRADTVRRKQTIDFWS